MLHHPDIPESHRVAAETIRGHLVHLRGGAPFLSPADSLQLVSWLDQGVATEDVLIALERCAASRRKNRARTRFTLVAARRHLGKPPLSPSDLRADVDVHPFEPVARQLAETEDVQAHELGEALTALSGDDVIPAVRLVNACVEQRWEALSGDEREKRLADAVRQMGDLANLVDQAALVELAEEVARHAFRAEWPRLDTTVFQGLVSS